MLFPPLYGGEKFFNSRGGCRQPLLLGRVWVPRSAPTGCPLHQKRVVLDGARLGQGAGGRGSGHGPRCSASGAGMMAENIPAYICSHLATACSPGCFSRRVWSVLAKESLLFPKRAYRFVLDNDGNFRHFFFHLEANRRDPAFAGGTVLVFLRAESHRTDKVSPKCCCPCRCRTWEGWVGGGGELISEL